MTSVLPEPGTISLARGIPSPEMLPVHALAECAARAVERFGDVALNYGDPAGFAPLREWLAERHGVSPSRVFVTPGSLVALNLIVRRLLEDPGRVLVEAPTYDRMLHLLGLAGAEIAPVPHDGDGLDPDALSALLKAGRHPEFVYVLPTFHNPTGRTLTRTARERVADIAVEHDLVVVEDDPYGLLRLEGEPLPTLHALLTERGRGDLGIFLSSFSKSVAPGLRVGYAVVPEAPGRGYRGARHVAVRVAAAARTGAAVRVPRQRACSTGTCRRCARSCAPAATRCSRCSRGGSTGMPAGRARRGATSCGLTSTSMPRRWRPGHVRVGSRSCPAAGSSRRVAAGAALACPTATRRSPMCGPPRSVSRS